MMYCWAAVQSEPSGGHGRSVQGPRVNAIDDRTAVARLPRPSTKARRGQNTRNIKINPHRTEGSATGLMCPAIRSSPSGKIGLDLRHIACHWLRVLAVSTVGMYRERHDATTRNGG